MSMFPRVPTEKVESYDFHAKNTMKIPTAELLILGEEGREGGKDGGREGRERGSEGRRERGREGGRIRVV